MFEDLRHIQKFVGCILGPGHIIQPHVSQTDPRSI